MLEIFPHGMRVYKQGTPVRNADGSVYSLGNAAAYGPIRSMCTNKAKTELWGVAGDDEDMGTIFTYDDQQGITQLGVISYNSHGWMDGPTAAHVLTSIAGTERTGTHCPPVCSRRQRRPSGLRACVQALITILNKGRIVL